MGNRPDRAGAGSTPGSVQGVPEKHNPATIKAAIVGGGRACYELLKLLDRSRSSRLDIEILGVSDTDSHAPGLAYADQLNLFTSPDIRDLLKLKGLNLIIELTGLPEAEKEILMSKPPGVSLMNRVSARLLQDLIRMDSEKLQLQKDLDTTKKQTKVVPDALPYRIMVINMDKTVETVNRTFLNAFDLTEEMILEKHCYELRYGLDRPCGGDDGGTCYIDDRLKEIKEKGIFSTIKEFPSDSGESRFEVITLAPIMDENGEVIQVLEASRDVTDRIKLESDVRKSETFLHNVIQSTVDGIVVVDTKGNVLIFNEGMERLTGFSAREIINKGHLSSFYPIDMARENMKKMRSNMHGPLGKLNPTSMTIRTKRNEEIPVTLSASIITIDGKEIGSVGIFTDMRELLEMRKNLEEAHLQLVQSEKIASVGRMAAGVAHEINNPLSGIMIYAELLKQSFKENSQHFNDIQEIIDQHPALQKRLCPSCWNSAGSPWERPPR